MQVLTLPLDERSEDDRLCDDDGGELDEMLEDKLDEELLDGLLEDELDEDSEVAGAAGLANRDFLRDTTLRPADSELEYDGLECWRLDDESGKDDENPDPHEPLVPPLPLLGGQDADDGGGIELLGGGALVDGWLDDGYDGGLEGGALETSELTYDDPDDEEPHDDDDDSAADSDDALSLLDDVLFELLDLRLLLGLALELASDENPDPHDPHEGNGGCEDGVGEDCAPDELLWWDGGKEDSGEELVEDDERLPELLLWLLLYWECDFDVEQQFTKPVPHDPPQRMP